MNRSTLCANKKHHYFLSGSYIHLTKCTSKNYTNSQAKCTALQVFTRKANEYCFRALSCIYPPGSTLFALQSPRAGPRNARGGIPGCPGGTREHPRCSWSVWYPKTPAYPRRTSGALPGDTRGGSGGGRETPGGQSGGSVEDGARPGNGGMTTP